MDSQEEETRKRKQGYIRLKKFVRKVLDAQGYEHVQSRNLSSNILTDIPLYMMNCNNGGGVFGSGYKVPFTLFNPRMHHKPTCVQCRWQGVNGSTDRKLVFDVESIKIGEHNTIIVIEGSQFKQEVEDWLQRCAGKDRLIRVFRSRQFYRFVKDGGLWNLEHS